VEQKSFPQFSEEILSAMRGFGGSVFVKLNWSSPKDATWVSLNKNLKCSSLSQVYLLLKSSDHISHDLTMPFDDCEDKNESSLQISYSLVLRKWLDINPSTEWRCFVKNGDLIGISQRDTASYYAHMEKDKHSIKQDISSFYREHIQDEFPSSSFVFDVTRPAKDKVILLDFNPFGETTDSLLFQWGELLQWNNVDACELRFIPSAVGVQPSPRQGCGLPVDMTDLASGSDPLKLIDFLKLQGQPGLGQDSDSE